jgi:hypothetical protein
VKRGKGHDEHGGPEKILKTKTKMVVANDPPILQDVALM